MSDYDDHANRNIMKHNYENKTIKRENKTIKRANKTIKSKSCKIIRSNTPVIQQELGNKIRNTLLYDVLEVKPKSASDINTIISSFTPRINREFKTKIAGSPIHKLHGCIDYSIINTKHVPKIEHPNGKCISYFNNNSQQLLLTHLAHTRDELKWENVTSPKQYQSNCWFNTMFMALFISDKGRKFLKFFRHMMITGRKINGELIKPNRLRNAFAYLNLAIDASLTSNVNILDTLDTNVLISMIYNSIPSTRINRHIKEVGEGGNPYTYYTTIMEYLNDNSISMRKIHERLDKNARAYHTSVNIYSDIPDIIVLELNDNDSTYYNIKPVLNIRQSDGTYINYKLDSCIIRDTNRKHFCALLEIGKVECGFDGASFRKLSAFEWKSTLNSGKKWTFKGSTWRENKKSTKKQIFWNFKKGYQMLFYYRD